MNDDKKLQQLIEWKQKKSSTTIASTKKKEEERNNRLSEWESERSKLSDRDVMKHFQIAIQFESYEQIRAI